MLRPTQPRGFRQATTRVVWTLPRVGLHGRVTVAEDYDRTEAVVSSHHHAFFDVGLPLLAGIYTDNKDGEEQLVGHLHCLFQAIVFIFLQRKAALLPPYRLPAENPISHNKTTRITSRHCFTLCSPHFSSLLHSSLLPPPNTQPPTTATPQTLDSSPP